MLNDDVVRLDDQSAADEGDAGIGGGLAGDGCMGLAQNEGLAPKIDDAADFEDDQARAGGLDRGPQ